MLGPGWTALNPSTSRRSMLSRRSCMRRSEPSVASPTSTSTGVLAREVPPDRFLLTLNHRSVATTPHALWNVTPTGAAATPDPPNGDPLPCLGCSSRSARCCRDPARRAGRGSLAAEHRRRRARARLRRRPPGAVEELLLMCAAEPDAVGREPGRRARWTPCPVAGMRGWADRRAKAYEAATSGLGGPGRLRRGRPAVARHRRSGPGRVPLTPSEAIAGTLAVPGPSGATRSGGP